MEEKEKEKDPFGRIYDKTNYHTEISVLDIKKATEIMRRHSVKPCDDGYYHIKTGNPSKKCKVVTTTYNNYTPGKSIKTIVKDGWDLNIFHEDNIADLPPYEPPPTLYRSAVCLKTCLSVETEEELEYYIDEKMMNDMDMIEFHKPSQKYVVWGNFKETKKESVESAIIFRNRYLTDIENILSKGVRRL